MQAIDLNALRVFVTIVDAGNQSAAARQLKMTRSNVSHRLKELEDSLGVQLLRRTTRQMELTEVGLGIYQHGVKIMQEMAAAQALISTAGQSHQGHVRLSVSDGLGLAVLSNLLVDFKRAHPAVTLDIIFTNQVSNLVAQHIDIALRVMSRPPDNADATALASVKWVACCHPDYLKRTEHPLHTLEDLRHHEIICSAAVGQPLKLKGRYTGGTRHVELQPAVRSENFVLLKRVVLGGLGVGFMPLYLVRDELESGALTQVLNYYSLSLFGSRIYLITTADRFQTLATQALVNFLKAGLTDDALYPARHNAVNRQPPLKQPQQGH